MVLRRYTPPTCTLEIAAKDSPLSRWAGQPVLKSLRFELRFDDPRQPEEERVTLWGDRVKLEALYEAVTIYVQNFLEAETADNFGLSISNSPLEYRDGVGANQPPENPKFPAEPAKSLPFARVTPSAEQPHKELETQAGSESEFQRLNTFQLPHLKPKGLLSHDLFLGQLATPETGPVIQLSAIQLFDLATALDEYAAEVVALPTLNRTSWLKSPPAWARSAAMFLLAVGLTTAVIKLLDRPSPTVQSAAQPSNQPTSIAQVPPTAQASPLPTIGVPAAPSTLSPSPSPSVSASPLVPPVLIPNTPPNAGSLPSQPITPSPTTITGDSPASNSNSVPAQAFPRPAGGSVPTLSGGSASPTETNQATKRTAAPSPTTFPLPSLSPLSKLNVPVESEPAGGVARGSADRSVSLPAAASPSELNPNRGGASRGEVNSAESSQDSRLFDTIPQVAQVRNYLQERWKPPEGLTQDLQYYLLLEPNGSVARITPFGEAAKTYIANTGIPLPGKPFVSPLQGDRNAKIRVVLSPDGKVETFLEP